MTTEITDDMTTEQAKAEALKRWPHQPGFQWPIADTRVYRGKLRNVVGYASASGRGSLTTDHVCGYGETWKEAFAKADAKGRR
jgi:hypothetical protein